MDYGSWHYQPCEDCGTYVLTRARNGTIVLCKECKDDRKKERGRLYNVRRYGSHHSDCQVIIEHDPIPFYNGGFRSGAGITIEELKYGLSMQVFSPGSIFMVKGKRVMLRSFDGEHKLLEV